MLLQFPFLSPKGRGLDNMKRLPCVCLSHFYINIIYEDMFTKFAENVYGCQNMSAIRICPHFKKQNGRCSRLFKNE